MSHGFTKITPVNGFDAADLNNARQNNYAWSMEELGDYIYVGTARNVVFLVFMSGALGGLKPPEEFVPQTVDNTAEIWRYKKDGTGVWEKVYKAAPALGIIGFRFMIRFTTPGGETALYAGAWTVGPKILILKSTDGLAWTVLDTGITTGSSTRAMVIHQEKLFMGVTSSESEGTKTLLYVSSDPEKESWQLVDTNGNVDSNPRGEVISMVSFNNQLYLGTAPYGGFEVWRTLSTEPLKDDWKLLVDKGAGDALNELPLSMAEFKNHIYVGSGIWFGISSIDPNKKYVPPKGFDIVRINLKDEWEVMVGKDPIAPTEPITGERDDGEFHSGFGDLSNAYCWQIKVFENELYVGSWDWSDLIEPILNSFTNVNKDAAGDTVMSLFMLLLKGILSNQYDWEEWFEAAKHSIKRIPGTLGFDLWKTTDGHDWSTITANGLDNEKNYGARMLLAASDGKLYLGTANPFQGCEVWVKEDLG